MVQDQKAPPSQGCSQSGLDSLEKVRMPRGAQSGPFKGLAVVLTVLKES